MSIASRINEIGLHLTEDWKSIEALTGTATVDKNIENIASVLNDLYDDLPKSTGEDTSLSLSTRPGKMQLTLKGNTSQESTTGKNLFNKATLNVNKGITSDGGLGDNTAISTSDYIEIQPNTNYYLSNVVGNIGRTCAYYDSSKTFISAVFQAGNDVIDIAQTTPNNASYMRIAIKNNTGSEDLAMVEKGSSKTSYEPYTGGNPAPNPSYPYPVKVVTGDNTIKVEGKNLFDITQNPILQKVAYNGSGTKVAWAGYVGIEQYIPINSNTTYTITSSLNINLDRVVYYNSSKDILSNTANVSTFTTPSGAKYIRFCYYISSETIPTWVQLEVGSSSSTYEPYQSQTYQVNIGDIELCKIGTYQDYFYKDSGKWYKHSEIGKVDLGSLNYNYNASYGFNSNDINTIVVPAPNNNTVLDVLSNVYTKATANQCYAITGSITSGISIGNAGTIIIRETGYSSVETYKNAMSGNSLYFPIKTPTNTEITDTNLINQLNTLMSAKSYSGTTNINQVNNDLPFIMSASALKGE